MKTDRNSLRKRVRRFSRYFYLKVMRGTGSPEYIARGAAVGIFSGFFFPINFQTIPAFLLAILVKGGKIPAILFTWFSNYATAVFFYPIQCLVGSYLIFNPISYPELKEELKTAIARMLEMNFGALLELGWDLALSFFAGGLFFGIIGAIGGYFVTLKLTRKFQARRKLAKTRGR